MGTETFSPRDWEPRSSLAAGKLPPDLLAEMLGILPTGDPQLILGPAVGEDAAVIDFYRQSDRLLVAKSDPITFATDEIGYYAVNVSANDLAVTGATPRYFLPTILLPAHAADVALARRIFEQIGHACRQLGVAVAGGHSEITHAVVQPVVAGTMLGEVERHRYVRSDGCRAGELVLLAGSVPVEGASIIAREKRADLLAAGWDAADLDEAAHYLYEPGISILPVTRLAVESGFVTAMHDPTEGGVINGLRELATAAKVGLQIDLDTIPVPDLAARLCRAFDLDPLGVIASGALLCTAPLERAGELLAQWRDAGHPGAIIGRVTPAEEGLCAKRRGRPCPFPDFPVDEITKLYQ